MQRFRRRAQPRTENLQLGGLHRRRRACRIPRLVQTADRRGHPPCLPSVRHQRNHAHQDRTRARRLRRGMPLGVHHRTHAEERPSPAHRPQLRQDPGLSAQHFPLHPPGTEQDQSAGTHHHRLCRTLYVGHSRHTLQPQLHHPRRSRQLALPVELQEQRQAPDERQLPRRLRNRHHLRPRPPACRQHRYGGTTHERQLPRSHSPCRKVPESPETQHFRLGGRFRQGDDDQEQNMAQPHLERRRRMGN